MHARSNMGLKLISWFLFLHLLIIMSFYGSRARELASAIEGGADFEAKSEEHQKSHAHNKGHNHMDPSVMVFFTINDLKVGQRIPIFFPKRTTPKFLTKEQADSIPFSLNQLPNLLKYFSISPNSPHAKAMEDTLSQCEAKPIEGEVKLCPTSLESMLEFTQKILGVKSESDIQVYATSHLTKSSVKIQNYTILDIVRIEATKMVTCHISPYPYAVFFCHSQGNGKNRLFKVSLVGDNGDKVESMAVCHMDTSHWGHDHVSFQFLGVTPGSSSVCHFFPADNLIWVPKLQPQEALSSM